MRPSGAPYLIGKSLFPGAALQHSGFRPLPLRSVPFCSVLFRDSTRLDWRRSSDRNATQRWHNARNEFTSDILYVLYSSFSTEYTIQYSLKLAGGQQQCCLAPTANAFASRADWCSLSAAISRVAHLSGSASARRCAALCNVRCVAAGGSATN